MKRRIIAFVLMVVVFVIGVVPGQALDGPEHDELMEMVLFGKKIKKHPIPVDAQEKAVITIETASYLCLDQLNGVGMDRLQKLIDYGIRPIPSSIDDINIDAWGWNHRKYTHKGWNYNQYESMDIWNKRKEILLSTTNWIFDFGKLSGRSILGFKVPYTKQCEAFSEFVYDIHVLGEYLEMKSITDHQGNIKQKEDKSQIMPFARDNAQNEQPDILFSLLHCIDRMFSKKVKDNYYYGRLVRELNMIALEARKLVNSSGCLETDEQFQQYKQYCEKTKNTLIEYIPDLLKQEKFFADVFYPVN